MSDPEPFRIPLHQLRLKPNIPAGGNGYVAMGMVPMLRGTSEDYDPVLVDDLCAKCNSWRIQDGRHRFFASVLAGRSDILARRDDLDEWNPEPTRRRRWPP